MGVGIVGEEGLQAVNSSDYAIAQVTFYVSDAVPDSDGVYVVPILKTSTSRPWPLVLRA